MFKKDDSLLIAIDYQEKLLPAIAENERVTERSARLISCMRVLDIPVLVTQQYTKGLGETVEMISSALGEFEPIEKTTFSCMRTDGFRKAFLSAGRKTVAVCGVEAHICVQQTVLELLEEGYRVIVVSDCVGSRDGKDLEVSLSRMEKQGAVITTYEALVYELLGSSEAEGFREISKIVK